MAGNRCGAKQWSTCNVLQDLTSSACAAVHIFAAYLMMHTGQTSLVECKEVHTEAGGCLIAGGSWGLGLLITPILQHLHTSLVIRNKSSCQQRCTETAQMSCIQVSLLIIVVQEQ